MTTYTMVVKSADNNSIHALEFTRDELHMVLNALEIHDAEAAKYETDVIGEELQDKFVKICYDYTDWEDIEPDQDQPVLQGSNE